MNLFDKMNLAGVIPVIAVENPKDAVPLAHALYRGGLDIIEVTFRTDCAVEVIKTMKQTYPDMIIGAGTVLRKEQVNEAKEAGCEFIVTPGFNEDVVDYCLSIGMAILPGTSCPSDIEKAVKRNLQVVKFFPAEINGGVAAIKALSAPYTCIKFMPTGGVNNSNLNDYLSCDRVLACGGTWMVKKDYLKNGQFDVIEKLTRDTVLQILNLQIAGVNAQTNSIILKTNRKERVEYYLNKLHLDLKKVVKAEICE